MKFENITVFKVDCPKHGKSGTELFWDGDIACTKCYKEYGKSEEKKEKRKEEKNKNEKKRIQEPILFTWCVFILLFSAYVISSIVLSKMELVLYVILGCYSADEIIRILKERKSYNQIKDALKGSDAE